MRHPLPPTVLVTNGIYATGGRAVYGMTNRVAVTKAVVTVRSVNGPQVTVIQGYQVPGTTNGNGAIRCVYLTNGSSLSGFTLTNGAARALQGWPPDPGSSGGGVWCESTNALVTNCIIVGQIRRFTVEAAYGGALYNLHLERQLGKTGTGAGRLAHGTCPAC